MKRPTILGGVVVVVLLLAITYVWGPSSVPAGQPPLVTLSNRNFGEFERAFDAKADVPRLVLLLSPTCPTCLRGASAAQQLLARFSNQKVSVLVVWEPMLLTDWRPPSASTLARIPDSRVRQFWDPEHVVAGALNELAKQKPPQPEPQCCVRKGFYWDESILYAPREHWEDRPESAFWDGPVVRTAPALEKSFEEQQSKNALE